MDNSLTSTFYTNPLLQGREGGDSCVSNYLSEALRGQPSKHTTYNNGAMATTFLAAGRREAPQRKGRISRGDCPAASKFINLVRDLVIKLE